MIFVRNFKLCVAAMVIAVVGSTGQLAAQDEISPEHLKAAARAISASKSTERLNDILPGLVIQTKELFSRTNPTLASEIDVAADEAALQLLDTRLELENQIREIWARRFTIEELNAIRDFYKTDVGKKLAEKATDLNALTVGAAKQWSDRISTDLVTKVREELTKKGHQL